MNEFDRMINNLSLLNETELEALAEVCQARAEGKKKARRDALRQELIGNLQKAIGDILHNGFTITIRNTELDPNETDYTAVYFSPEDIYSIKIE